MDRGRSRSDALEHSYEFQKGSGFLKGGTDDFCMESMYVYVADRDEEGELDVRINGDTGGGDQVFSCW
jgi:hypothetical protein